MQKLFPRIFTQIGAQNALDNVKKTGLVMEPYLVTYHDEKDKRNIITFCWVAQDKEKTTTVIMHPHREDIELDSKFETTNFQKLEAPMFFFCNRGAFVLKDDLTYGLRIDQIDEISSLSMAQNFAKSLYLNPSNLILCSQHDRHENLINVAWVDLSSDNNDCIPVWNDDKLPISKKCYQRPLAVGSEFRFNNRIYVVCKTFGETYIKPKSLVRFGPHMGCKPRR